MLLIVGWAAVLVLAVLAATYVWKRLGRNSLHREELDPTAGEPPVLFVGDVLDSRLHEIFSNCPHTASAADDCNLVLHDSILWANSRTPKILAELSKKHLQSGKKVVIFIVDDYEYRYRYFPNLILLRTSLRASMMRRNEHVLPYVWETLGSPYAPIEDCGIATVGFCGLASAKRKELFEVFENSRAVRTDFIKRDTFWGGSPHNPALVAEFNRNIRENQFILCNRGSGNFSMRFYQTLSAGRIPVLVDTDMRLPFDQLIDWKQTIVIERNETECLRRTISIASAGKALEMQARCARVFQTYFDRSVVGKHLLDAIGDNSYRKPRFGY